MYHEYEYPVKQHRATVFHILWGAAVVTGLPVCVQFAYTSVKVCLRQRVVISRRWEIAAGYLEGLLVAQLVV